MRHAIAAAVLVLAAASAAAAQTPQRVGRTAAVNPTTTGTPKGGETRVLEIGKDVTFEERVVTSDVGQAQLLFLDKTTLTIGPNAEVVLDRFVYDPNTSTGELALSITKGVFRFIGGKISETSGVTIRTPTATLGIRGSIVIGRADPLDVIYVSGRDFTVTNPEGYLRFERTGHRAQVAAPNQPPRDLGRASAGDVQGFVEALEGSGGGGAPEKPTAARVTQALAAHGGTQEIRPIVPIGPVTPPDVLTIENNIGVKEIRTQVIKQDIRPRDGVAPDPTPLPIMPHPPIPSFPLPGNSRLTR